MLDIFQSIFNDSTTFVLQHIWWLLLGVLLIGFAIMNGFDLGVASILHLVAKNDDERRVVINTVGPFWEGNQIWLVLGGGAIFAAFAKLYAISFSGFYIAMLLLLFALILRPVGFKFRSKVANPLWRSIWDIVLAFGGFIPALITGVAVGNVLWGVPFDMTNNINEVRYNHAEGHLFYLLFGSFGFSLLTGLLSVSMMAMQGGNYLSLKTEGHIKQRAAKVSSVCAIISFVLFALGGVLITFMVKGYLFDGSDSLNLSIVGSTEIIKSETSGAWLTNYGKYPIFMLAPVLGFAGILLSFLFNKMKRFALAFISSSVAIFGIIATVGVSIYPLLLPSSSNPLASLTLYNSANSDKTLAWMTLMALIFVPIILSYTSWVHYVLRGTVTVDSVKNDNQAY